MSRPMSAAAATQHWTGFDLRCRCGAITQNRYPGHKSQAALRRLRAEASRALCQSCKKNQWEQN